MFHCDKPAPEGRGEGVLIYNLDVVCKVAKRRRLRVISQLNMSSVSFVFPPYTAHLFFTSLVLVPSHLEI
jgi:hypothetical protein